MLINLLLVLFTSIAIVLDQVGIYKLYKESYKNTTCGLSTNLPDNYRLNCAMTRIENEVTHNLPNSKCNEMWYHKSRYNNVEINVH